ncbi:MAG: DUF192 domain-containing protein [Anaerolineae bacterium]|nr:DUF192 domain-containing protein [Anaerolineae bacterium]
MNGQRRVLKRASNGEIVLSRVKWCQSFWCHFRGLQLVRRLPADEGLLFITDHEGRGHTAIHMFFMLFSIGVVWMDSSGKVVDKCLAKPWRPVYAPQFPAQYYLEANVDILDRVALGDVLQFDEVVG